MASWQDTGESESGSHSFAPCYQRGQGRSLMKNGDHHRSAHSLLWCTSTKTGFLSHYSHVAGAEVDPESWHLALSNARQWAGGRGRVQVPGAARGNDSFYPFTSRCFWILSARCLDSCGSLVLASFLFMIVRGTSGLGVRSRCLTGGREIGELALCFIP